MTSDTPARSANIFDVARLAGVSHQTVSRVINDLPNVRPATRARVEHAIAQLRYSPSPAARALVTRRTRTIGLITPGVSDYGPTSTAMHFNFAARAARYSVDMVSLLDSDPASIRQIVESLLRQRVDALVVVVVDGSVLETIRSLELGIPLVAAAASEHTSRTLVSIDQYNGARSAVNHLVASGHRRVAHIAGPPRSPDAIERIRGWRDELAAHRLEVVEPSHGDWSAASGYRLGIDLDLAGGDAVFCANDHMAVGLFSALRERGLRVPDDISVVGYDDVPEAAYAYPPLTTVRQDFAGLGELIMQRVLLAVEQPDDESVAAPLPTQLIVRGSTRPAAG
ncbi:MAG: LacI family DNA-binding transcriptional regulator [Actinobacteria bacterium]|nr:LacI family DNA-binding transcriptional regulator [Actinomycetota bacterium]